MQKQGPWFQGQSMQIRQDIEEGGSPFRNELRVVVCFEGMVPGLLSNENRLYSYWNITWIVVLCICVFVCPPVLLLKLFYIIPESACEGFFVKKQPCCNTSSHPHICWSTSSHPHICWSTSSHLHICRSRSSHPHICRSPLALLSISLLRRGRCRRSATKRNPFARNGGWTSKTEGKLRFNLVSQMQPFRTKWRLDVKNCEKIAI